MAEGQNSPQSPVEQIVEIVRGWMISRALHVAAELNRRGILTPRGGEWQPTTVVRLLARLALQAA
jgi:hypothetical protein